jgi:hypothetical protein
VLLVGLEGGCDCDCDCDWASVGAGAGADIVAVAGTLGCAEALGDVTDEEVDGSAAGFTPALLDTALVEVEVLGGAGATGSSAKNRSISIADDGNPSNKYQPTESARRMTPVASVFNDKQSSVVSIEERTHPAGICRQSPSSAGLRPVARSHSFCPHRANKAPRQASIPSDQIT